MGRVVMTVATVVRRTTTGYRKRLSLRFNRQMAGERKIILGRTEGSQQTAEHLQPYLRRKASSWPVRTAVQPSLRCGDGMIKDTPFAMPADCTTNYTVRTVRSK